jgi:hypothetical protein
MAVHRITTINTDRLAMVKLPDRTHRRVLTFRIMENKMGKVEGQIEQECVKVCL